LNCKKRGNKNKNPKEFAQIPRQLPYCQFLIKSSSIMTNHRLTATPIIAPHHDSTLQPRTTLNGDFREFQANQQQQHTIEFDTRDGLTLSTSSCESATIPSSPQIHSCTGLDWPESNFEDTNNHTETLMQSQPFQLKVVDRACWAPLLPRRVIGVRGHSATMDCDDAIPTMPIKASIHHLSHCHVSPHHFLCRDQQLDEQSSNSDNSSTHDMSDLEGDRAVGGDLIIDDSDEDTSFHHTPHVWHHHHSLELAESKPPSQPQQPGSERCVHEQVSEEDQASRRRQLVERLAIHRRVMQQYQQRKAKAALSRSKMSMM